MDGDFIAMISTHVDDYIIATNDDNYYKKFMEEFGKKFTVTELGVLDHILQIGVQWSADRKKVELSQERHIRELAEAHGLQDCKPISTPMEKDLHLEPAKECNAALPYRSIIGSLLWIARATRPDILYAVIYLARFSSCYDNTHFVAAKRIVRYLMSTLSTKLTYHKQEDKEINLIVYSDSDWASDKNDRKSFAGNVVYLNKCHVSWGCKKQITVALSSTEAEYMAMSDCSRENLYVQGAAPPARVCQS